MKSPSWSSPSTGFRGNAKVFPRDYNANWRDPIQAHREDINYSEQWNTETKDRAWSHSSAFTGHKTEVKNPMKHCQSEKGENMSDDIWIQDVVNQVLSQSYELPWSLGNSDDGGYKSEEELSTASSRDTGSNVSLTHPTSGGDEKHRNGLVDFCKYQTNGGYLKPKKLPQMILGNDERLSQQPNSYNAFQSADLQYNPAKPTLFSEYTSPY